MKLARFGVVVVLMLLATANVYAQGGVEAVRDRVEEFFRNQYGRDYALVEYTFAYQTWADNSLGCPQPGLVYTQQTVEGYRWTLEINDGNTYELHSNLDGSLVVLCTPIDRARLVDYTTYQNGNYLIDYPDSWLISAADDLSWAIISPTATENCNASGMKILLRQPVGNANTMLDDAIREAGLVQNMGARTPIGDTQTALSVLYQANCNGAIVQYRTTAFPDAATSTGYLVVQWTPLADYSSWAAVYTHILATFQLIDDLDSADADSIDPARLLAGYPLAHIFVQDVYIGQFNDLPGEPVTVGSSRARRGLAFSADGQYLAYIDPSESSGADWLEVVGLDLPRTTVSRNVAPGFTPSWSPTNATLAFLETGTTAQTLDIYAASLANLANPQLLGTIPFNDDCLEPSTPYITKRLYWQETGVNGNKFMFQWMPDNRFLYTTSCDGIGLALWNPADNVVQELGTDLRRAAITEDFTRLAAIDSSQSVFLIDLTNGTRSPLLLDYPADQLAWSNSGRKLYYSHIFQDSPYMVSDPTVQERATETLGVFPYESYLNTVSVLEYDFGTGENRAIWQGQGYAIGRILAAPNNAGLLLTLIPSDRNYVMNFVQNTDSTALRFSLPETELYWLSPLTQEAQLLAVTSQPEFAPVVPPQ